jgi:hypothetical protein
MIFVHGFHPHFTLRLSYAVLTRSESVFLLVFVRWVYFVSFVAICLGHLSHGRSSP